MVWWHGWRKWTVTWDHFEQQINTNISQRETFQRPSHCKWGMSLMDRILLALQRGVRLSEPRLCWAPALKTRWKDRGCTKEWQFRVAAGHECGPVGQSGVCEDSPLTEATPLLGVIPRGFVGSHQGFDCPGWPRPVPGPFCVTHSFHHYPAPLAVFNTL